MSKLAPFVPLMQTIIWIVLIGVLLAIFFKQCRAIIEAVKTRIERGSSFKAGPVELGEDLRDLQKVEEQAKPSEVKELPTPQEGQQSDWAAEREKIYEDACDIFLVHVIEPSKEPGHAYDIFIYLKRHKKAPKFKKIRHAEFFFGHYWGNKVFKELPKDGLIGFQPPLMGRFYVFVG